MPNRAFYGFTLSILLPSTALVQRYLGLVGVAAYLLIALLICLLVQRNSTRIIKALDQLSQRQQHILAAVMLVTLLAIFFVVYPIANSGRFGGGSDGDDALQLAASELISGRYPYYPKTYLDNPISPLPGAVLLAIPFTLLGTAALHNFFWISLFFLMLRSRLKHTGRTLLLAAILLILSPAILYSLVIGSDYVANSLYILLFIVWVSNDSAKPDRQWLFWLAALGLGLAYSSRANFIFTLPIVLMAIQQRRGWSSALVSLLLISGGFLATTLPFYLYDPAGFSPLHTVNEMDRYQTVLPYAAYVVAALTAFVAITLALTVRKFTYSTLLASCMIVLALPVICGLVLSSVQQGHLVFSFAAFGMFFLWFGVAAFGGEFIEAGIGQNEAEHV